MDLKLLGGILVFLCVYGLIVFRNVRGVNFPIWFSMTLGAFAVLGLQFVTPKEAFSSINFDVIFFLFGMFILVSGLERSGTLGYFTYRILSLAKTPSHVLFVILFVMGILSAFLINDTVALIATPIVIGLAKKMNMRVTPLLISLAFSVTIGSAMTPMGNPQNLLVALHSGMSIPLFTFLKYLAVPTILSLVCTYFVLKKYYQKDLAVAVIPKKISYNNIVDLRLSKSSSILTIITVTGFFIIGIIQMLGIYTTLNFSHMAVFGGLALLVINKQKRKIISGVNWQILVFFVAMFVFTAGLQNSGVIDLFQSFLPFKIYHKTAESTINIAWTSIMTSQLVSNVPFVAIYLPILQSYGFGPDDTISWLSLAAFSTISGNLTILAAASNVIILQEAEKRKQAGFTFKEFFRIGAVITTINFVIFSVFLMYNHFLIFK